METKTTNQVIKFAIEVGVIGEHNGMIICKSDRDKMWVDVDGLIKWIQSMQIDGTMCIAKTDFLKGQKNGEMMMLRKMYDAITSTSPNKDVTAQSDSPKVCPHCNIDISIRNPSGYCDHLYYPEYCEVCKKRECKS